MPWFSAGAATVCVAARYASYSSATRTPASRHSGSTPEHHGGGVSGESRPARKLLRRQVSQRQGDVPADYDNSRAPPQPLGTRDHPEIGRVGGEDLLVRADHASPPP